LLLIDRRTKVRPGNLMALYVGGYGVIRFFVEGLRIDEAHRVGGLRWNQWVALAAIVGAALYLFMSSRREPAPATFELPVEAEGETTDEDLSFDHGPYPERPYDGRRDDSDDDD
jgi:prolipoprotein diacylglyceryltransferase